jgi:coproporphyrinogen III oxidase-like Fe-S oxidoreductase
MVNADGHGFIEQQELSPDEQAPEFLLMGLRISEGIDMKRYEQLAGTPLDSYKIANLESLGFVKKVQGRLIATPRGRPILNAIIRELNG